MAENCQIDTFAQGVWFLRTSFVLLLAAMGQHSELLHSSKKTKPLETAEILQVPEAEAIPAESKAAQPAAPSIDAESQVITFADRTPAVPRTLMVSAGTALRERRPAAANHNCEHNCEPTPKIQQKNVVLRMPKQGMSNVNF